MVPTAAMSGARHKQLAQGKCLGPKQSQLFTMHNQDFLVKDSAIKGLVVYRANGRFTQQLYVSRCMDGDEEGQNLKRHQAPQWSSSHKVQKKLVYFLSLHKIMFYNIIIRIKASINLGSVRLYIRLLCKKIYSLLLNEIGILFFWVQVRQNNQILRYLWT